MKNMIGRNIKYLRDTHNLSQEQLAEKLGVSRQTVAKWESGETTPDIEHCAELALMFTISLDALATCPLDDLVTEQNTHADGKYVFGIVKVGERGQVVIPKHARDVYDIKPGSKILVVGDERGMAFVKMKELPSFHFGG